MAREDFIPILECVLRCADPHIVEVSDDPADPNKIRVFLDDCSTIEIGVCDLSNLDVLGMVVMGVITKYRKDY